jgi:hypothetical protein
MHVRERLEVATRREAEGTCKDGAKSLLARYISNLSHMSFLTACTGPSISHVYSRSKPDLLLVNLTMAQQIANRIEDGWIAVRVVTFFVDAYNQHKSNGL